MKKLTKQSRVRLVESPAYQFGILNGDLSRDIYTRLFRMPSRALHVLEGILRPDFWENVRSLNPFYNGKNGKFTEDNFGEIYNSDAVLCSCITRTFLPTMELVGEYKLRRPDGIAILGGPHVTVCPEEALERGADIVVLKEGERTFQELMTRLTEDPESLDDIDGIAFKKGSGIQINKPRKLLTPEELSQLPHPYYAPEFRKNGFLSLSVIETARGCPHNCDFCGVTQMYGGKYRGKSDEYVLEELRRIRGYGNVNFITDDNHPANHKRTINLHEKIIDSGLQKTTTIQVDVKAAENPELLKVLRKSGVNALCVGIESFNDETLRALGKPFSAKQNLEAIKTFKDAGFWVHGMFMIGGKGDTPETLRESSYLINRILDSVQFFAEIPLPGTRFTKRMEQEGRILTKDYSLYDGLHVIVRPDNFTPYELQRTLVEMHESFYSFWNNVRRFSNSQKKKTSAVIGAYTSFFGGFREVLHDPQSRKHLEFLKRVS